MVDIKQPIQMMKKPSSALLNKYSSYLSELISGGANNNPYIHWNILLINDVPVPGKVDIEIQQSKNLTRQKALSWEGESVIDSGKKAASVSVKIMLNGDDWTVFRDLILPILELNSISKEQNVLKLSNELFKAHAIEYVMLESSSTRTPQGGMTEVSLSFVEWKYDPKPKKTVKPNVKPAGDSSVSTAGKSGASDPLAPPGTANDRHTSNEDLGGNPFTGQSLA